MTLLRITLLSTILLLCLLLAYLFIFFDSKYEAGRALDYKGDEETAAAILDKAKNEINEGHYLQVRQRLEQESRNTTGEKQDLIHLLLGMSYIKEASEKAAVAATPYYQLAFSYLNRIPRINERFKQESNEILDILQHQVNTLLDNQTTENLFFYTTVLENWQAHAYLKILEERLLQLLNKQISEDNWKAIREIGVSLNQIVKEKKQRQELEQKFATLFKKGMREGNTELAEKNWEMTRLFSSEPEKLTEKISSETAYDILSMIPLDDPQLTYTTPYIEFWENNVKDRKNRLNFAKKLAELAQNLWVRDNQTEKALTLFQLATTIPQPPDKETLRQFIATQMKEIYSLALKTDNDAFLQALLKAQDSLNLKEINFNIAEDTTKQVKEATSLFLSGNDAHAFQKAKWVLKVEPDNQEALSLAGRASYNLADYEQSIKFLKLLKSLDENTAEKLAVSEIIAGDKSKGQVLLDQLKKERPLNAQVYSRLGFGTLERNDPTSSLQWFKLIADPDEEVLAGTAYALFKTGQWQKTLSIYPQLSPPFQKMSGLQSMAFSSLLALGRNDEAEQLLQDLIKKPVEEMKETPHYSAPFRSFKLLILDPQTPNFIAGRYYKNVKKDPQKALEYFKNIKPLTSQVLVEVGEIFFSQGKDQEAADSLKNALAESNQTALMLDIQKRALPLLAASYARQGYYVDAATSYAQYLNQFPQEIELRSPYASALMELHRFDLALEQLKILEKVNQLTTSDEINLVTSLIHTDQFQEAGKKVSQLLAVQPPLPPLDQLKLAELLLIVRDNDLIEKILKNLPPSIERSLEVNEAVLSFLIVQGDYEKALALSKSIQSNLENSAQGLLLLAKLDANFSDRERAIREAKQAQKLDPQNAKIREFLELYNPDIASINKRLEEIQKKSEADPFNLSLQIELGNTLIEKAIKRKAINPSISMKEVPELRKAYVMLEKLAEKVNDQPRLYFLYGKAAFLLGEFKTSLEVLQKAINLDISYVEAYKYLSLGFATMKDDKNALKAIQKSVLFWPQDGEAWLQMANLYHKINDGLDALIALEHAIKYKPNDPNAYITAAEIRLELNDPEGAKIALEKALKISPKNVKALTLMLITLYDPFLEVDGIKKNELLRQQTSIYETLHALEPMRADELLKKLKH